MESKNKVVLITGVAGGIGRATALAFHRKGWFVIGVDRKGGEDVEGVDKYLTADISKAEESGALFDAVANVTDGLDALVNNAAIQICKPIVETSVEEWDSVMASNLRSVFLGIRHAYPLLKKRAGSIVNVSSVHAVATSENIGAYAASKGGLLSFTRALAIEFSSDDIRVNAVLPGAVDTSMLRRGLNRGHVDGGDVEERIRALGTRHLIGRVGQPDEIAQAIIFLANNEQSSFVTGQALIVDGGATTRLSTE